MILKGESPGYMQLQRFEMFSQICQRRYFSSLLLVSCSKAKLPPLPLSEYTSYFNLPVSLLSLVVKQ